MKLTHTKIQASTDTISIPRPYDKYYEIMSDAEVEDITNSPAHPSPCEECKGYDVVSYAYLIAKPEYADEMMADGIDYAELISESGGTPFVAYVVHDRIIPVLGIDLPDEENEESLIHLLGYIQAASDANLNYWYLTKHGLGPGMVPRDVHLIDVVEVGWDTYILLDRMLTTEELAEYGIQEQRPPEGSITCDGSVFESKDDSKCEGQQIQGSESEELNRKYYEEMKSRGEIDANEPYYDWMDYTPIGESNDFKSQELADEEDYYDYTHGEGDYSDNSGRGDLLYNREFMSDKIAGRFGISQKLGETIYDWYDLENVWEDFNSPEEFLKYLDNDIYSMLDACDDEILKEEVKTAITSSTDIDGASQPVEGMSLIRYKDHKIMPNTAAFCWEVLDNDNYLVETGFKNEGEAKDYIDKLE